MTDERDDMIERIAAVLRPLPAVDSEAKARVLVAVAAEREHDRRGLARRLVFGPAGPWILRAGGLAAAILVAVVVLRPTLATTAGNNLAQQPPAPATPTALATEATLATRSAAEPEAATIPVQLVFRAPAASRVRVVGDFNGWDGTQAAMTRDAANGLWSTTLALRPGRHVYAFVVDDTIWVRDPRAPAASDADFGRPGSVLLVGRP